MRLDKFICDTKNITRKESKEFIKKGKVSVNGLIQKDAGLIIDENNDDILFFGERIIYKQFVYYMLNKPSGVVSATKDEDKTVIDLLKTENRNDLFPVGRLDKDTVGLLLITNDGAFSHHLTSPNHHVTKKYYVETSKPLSKEDISKLEEGIELHGDGITKPAKVERISEHSIYLSISEGMYHQIKRMLIAVGNEVAYLKRVSMGKVSLDENLSEGEYRELTDEEIKILKE